MLSFDVGRFRGNLEIHQFKIFRGVGGGDGGGGGEGVLMIVSWSKI